MENCELCGEPIDRMETVHYHYTSDNADPRPYHLDCLISLLTCSGL